MALTTNVLLNICTGSRSLWKRLDRMLVNKAWLDKWPNASYISALPSTSDHSPLIIHGDHRGTDRRPFRFDNFLTNRTGFLDSVKRTWLHKIPGTAMYEMVCKLKALKLHFDNNGENLKINATRVRQRIYQISTPSGEVLTDMSEVTEEFVSYFKALLGGTRTRRDFNLAFLSSELKHCLTEDEAYLLCAPITVTEIKDAIFDIAEDSAPRMLSFLAGVSLLAQELLAGYNPTRLPPRCTIKVDLQKAYDSVQWDFRLEGSTGRSYAKVAWDQLCRPKEEGGLGVHNILVINKALMLKHLWKIIHNDRHSIWVDWILHHRLRNKSLWTFNGSTGLWGWKKIIKLRPMLQRGIIYQVGTGTTFMLWQDIWHQQGPLSISYPRGP
ncbi:UNVERIFIED_CONTAM: putative mitochondrial protein [Sesamum radiatum]|uniref:Mitochondrial protein n=1 Tax=Sesamum radiatum TaxID=300843 RepID=A0AAW2J1I5_SESRA